MTDNIYSNLDPLDKCIIDEHLNNTLKKMKEQHPQQPQLDGDALLAMKDILASTLGVEGITKEDPQAFDTCWEKATHPSSPLPPKQPDSGKGKGLAI